MTLFEYPKQAKLDRFLPKSKILEFAKPTSKVKELLVQQVAKITIAYNLSSRSLNLKATPSVPEIQVLRIELKTGVLKEEVLRCIDKAVPFPLIFELHYNNKQKMKAAFKRPSEADTTKWVTSEYFETEWLDDNAELKPLPVALDLGSLYDKLLESLMPHNRRDNENIQTHVTRMDQVHAKERELEKIQAKLSKEKQFNRKVVINTELRKIKQEIQLLTHSNVVDEH